MIRDPKTQKHPKSVYLIGIFVWLIVLFVLAGVVNHLAFSSRGPGLLIPLMKKFQKKESPDTNCTHKNTEKPKNISVFIISSRFPSSRRHCSRRAISATPTCRTKNKEDPGHVEHAHELSGLRDMPSEKK